MLKQAKMPRGISKMRSTAKGGLGSVLWGAHRCFAAEEGFLGGGHGNQRLLRRKMEKWKKKELWTGFLPGKSKEELRVGNRRERRTLSGRSGL